MTIPPVTRDYQLAALLAMFRDELHNTSQCHYLDPEGVENRIIQRIDAAIQEWFERAVDAGVDMEAVKRRLRQE